MCVFILFFKSSLESGLYLCCWKVTYSIWQRRSSSEEFWLYFHSFLGNWTFPQAKCVHLFSVSFSHTVVVFVPVRSRVMVPPRLIRKTEMQNTDGPVTESDGKLILRPLKAPISPEASEMERHELKTSRGVGESDTCLNWDSNKCCQEQPSS